MSSTIIVTSADGVKLSTKVHAKNHAQLQFAKRAIQAHAQTKSAAELVASGDYFQG